MEGFLPCLNAPGLITVPWRLEAFPVNTGHQPLGVLTYSTAGWGSAAERQEATVRQLLLNLLKMTTCVIPPIMPTTNSITIVGSILLSGMVAETKSSQNPMRQFRTVLGSGKGEAGLQEGRWIATGHLGRPP